MSDIRQNHIQFFFAPHTRALSTLVLLEELDVPYDLHVLSLKAGEQRAPAYLAVNPMGKVPAIRHNGALITEQVALSIFLSDLFPEKGLAPALDDPLRGPYLRWLVYYAACFEPAIIDRATKRDPAPEAMSPYGDFDSMFGTLTAQLSEGPYFLGERFSSLDALWSTALAWTSGFGLIPATPTVKSYIDRIRQRPAVVKAREIDARLAAEQEEKAEKATP